MNVYEVPEAAWDAVADKVTAQDAHDAAQTGAYGVTTLVERAVRTAAPLLLAAELRRLADELDVVKAEMREVDNRNVRSSGLGEGISTLRARAAVLDGATS